MDLSFILNFVSANDCLLAPLTGGLHSLDFLLAQVEASDLIFKERVALLVKGGGALTEALETALRAAHFSPVYLPQASNADFLAAFPPMEEGIYCVADGDAPFLDMDALKKRIEKHRQYGVDFSNADGYPKGLHPELLSARCLDALKKLATDPRSDAVKIFDGDSLFDLIALEVNEFDIETQIPDVDLSLLRLHLRSHSTLSLKTCQWVAEHFPTANGQSEAITDFIDKHREGLRLVPAYYAFQLTDYFPQRVAYLPSEPFCFSKSPAVHQMEIAAFQKSLQEIAEFSGEAVLAFGLWGEAAFHPEIASFVDAVMQFPKFSLLIETCGLGWDRKTVEAWSQRYAERIFWIVDLDTNQPQLYRKLRGDGFEEAFLFAGFISRQVGKFAYVQSIRMKENEADLPDFWSYWKEHGQVLIQKYNSFGGRLPDRRVVDLSPVCREACWHLKRELSVFWDGECVPCADDYGKSMRLGNLFTEGVAAVFKRGQGLFEDQCRGRFCGICGGCDEYYTFNF